jgi:hypothetical protein
MIETLIFLLQAPDVKVPAWMLLVMALATPFVTAVGIFVTAWMGRLASADSRNAAREARDAAKDATQATHNAATLVAEVAVKTEEVKDELKTSGNETRFALTQIHTLVNSAMMAQLQVNALDKRRIASMTQDPEDAQAATLAEGKLADHQARQAEVDEAKRLLTNSSDEQ